MANSQGISIAINAYDALGIPNPTNQGRFQYTGQTWLPELGMYHYKARLYSPTLGRFLQTDPVVYEDQVNLYAYVGNDPVNLVDPTGLRTKHDEEEPPDPDEIVVTATKLPPPPPPKPDDTQKLAAINRPGGDRERPTSGQQRSIGECLVESAEENAANLALDAAGVALVAASSKFQLAAAMGGLAVGSTAFVVSVANQDAAGAGLAYGGRTASVAGGLATAGSALARGAQRFGAAAVAFSLTKNLAEASQDYQSRRSR